MKDIRRKPNIAIIVGSGLRTSPEDAVPVEAILINFIEVLEPLTNRIYAITGNFAHQLDGKVRVIRLKAVARNEWLLVSFLRFIMAQLWVSLGILRIAMQVDIVIFHTGTRPFILPMFISRLSRRKTVSCVTGRSSKAARTKYRHALFGLGGLIAPLVFRLVERINFALAHQIAVEAPSAVKFLELERYHKKTVINRAMRLNTDLFRPLKSVAERKIIVGYVGRLAENKGILNFTEATPLMLKERDDLVVWIGGGGPLYDEVKRKLESYYFGERVELSGWIPHDELPKYLNGLKLMVFPSYAEGLPGIVLEAMGCGVVVLASPVGGVPDLIEDGVTGFILEDNSPECIAKSALLALEHPDLDSIARNARRLIENEYTYDIMVAKCREALDKLVVNGHSPMDK